MPPIKRSIASGAGAHPGLHMVLFVLAVTACLLVAFGRPLLAAGVALAKVKADKPPIP